jgi:hypothetical protein
MRAKEVVATVPAQATARLSVKLDKSRGERQAVSD